MALLALVLVGPVAMAADRNADLAEYRSVLTRYRGGDVDGAIATVAAWDDERLVDIARAIRGFVKGDRALVEPQSWDDASLLGAAYLLHLEALSKGPRPVGNPAVHLRVMGEYLDAIRTLEVLEPRTVALHLTLTLYLQGQLQVVELQKFLDDVGEAFDSSAAFSLAKGTYYEMLASRRLEAARNARLIGSAATLLAKAELLLRKAVAAAPQMAEARLRLAHVLLRQGKAEESLALLQALRDDPEPSIRYFATLFAGQAHRDGGRPVEAERSFAAAVAGNPCGQAAAMGLAALAMADGRIAVAREALENSLRRATDCTDAWAFYDFGQAGNLAERIETLRKEVRP